MSEDEHLFQNLLIKRSNTNMLLNKSLDFVCIIYHFPLEDASVVFTCREEVFAIVTEETRSYSKQVITVALIISLTSSVGIVEKTNSTQLISHCNDGPSIDLANLCYFISLWVPIVDTFELRIGTKSLTQPFKFKIDSISVNNTLGFNFEQ